MDIHPTDLTGWLSITGTRMNAARSTLGEITDYSMMSKWKWLFANFCECERTIATEK